jgi:hypothetical protein
MKTNVCGFLILFSMLLLISACAPQYNKYESDLYTMEYPVSWKMTDEKGVVTFAPNGDFGKIELKSYGNLNFPPPLVKNFMVEMHKLPITQDQINAKEVNGHFEYYFDYAADNKHIISKGMRINDDLFLLHSTCESEDWPKIKDEFLAILSSFTFK